MKIIDLRSDTVTRPGPAMRQAIAAAEVGDDVFGDDPTVRRLEEHVAHLLGKPAGLFVPSGTMGNQIALAIQTRPGDQVVLEANSHIYRFEAGAPAVFSGLWPTLLDAPDGALRWPQIEAALSDGDDHKPRASLVCLENTHNMLGGVIVPLETIDEVARGVRERGLRLHLDGARLWNAHVATGIPLARWCTGVDSASVCFSKGLGAPVGSVLVAGVEPIAAARRMRKRMGGGMRQAGLLAAACLYALEHNLPRLAEDHAKVQAIAEGLDHSQLRVEVPPQTNMVFLEVLGGATAAAVVESLARQGVWASVYGPKRLRLVTHLDVTHEDCAVAVQALNQLAF